MPQRMLHLLHVVTAFMAKWLTGHGRLRLFLRPRMVHPPIHIHIHIPIPMPIPNPIHSLWPVVPFAVACHVQAIRMFQKCFGHGSFCGSGSVYLPFRWLFFWLLLAVHLAVIVVVAPRKGAGGGPHTCVRT